MLQFVGGFIVGLLTIAVLLLRKRIAGTKGDRNNHLAQLEELSKLTGGLAHEIKNPLSTVKINLNLVKEELEDSVRAESEKTDTDKNAAASRISYTQFSRADSYLAVNRFLLDFFTGVVLTTDSYFAWFCQRYRLLVWLIISPIVFRNQRSYHKTKSYSCKYRCDKE